LQVQDFCRRSYIQVISLQLLCDTPGAYYYGSSAYRNSEVCVSGDKAHLAFQCKWIDFAANWLCMWNSAGEVFCVTRTKVDLGGGAFFRLRIKIQERHFRLEVA
jgi:hypothetical protein